jgi:putative tricarboxylic transport membrane protein
MMHNILTALSMSFSPETLLVLFIGVLFGAVIGALPGLGTCVAITVCLPFTLEMNSVPAIALLLGVYGSSIYGGSISAVLINTPGTPQSAATGMDGYPMAQAGKASEALGWVTSASIIGGLISCVALIVAAPRLAALSVKYGGPLEISALIFMGLACISSLAEGNQLKGIMTGLAGLLLATIGSDPVSGEIRFTFGSEELVAGISLMPLVVGVFPLAEVFYRIHELRIAETLQPIYCQRIKFPRLREWKGRVANLVRSSLIGVGLGILPGIGATASTFISYTMSKRLSKNGDNYGKGEPDGLVAAESSNNAITGGALIPTLALGIPGEPATALMLASLTLHNITPGVRLMADHPEVVYSAFITLIMSNIFLIPVALIVVRFFGYFIRVPSPLLLGFIVVCSMIGVYIPRGNFFDVPIALIIGVVAFLMRIGRFPITPLLIGYVLGPELEQRLSQAAVYKGDMPLFAYLSTSPLAMVLFIVAAFFLFYPMLKPLVFWLKMRNRHYKNNEKTRNERRSH